MADEPLPSLTVRTTVLRATFEALRRCGRGRTECVVYWTGPAGDDGIIDRVVHPRHASRRAWYEIESAWITEFFAEARISKRSIRAQVHTHPHADVGHSVIDDSFPIIPNIGFVSIVLPYFATGEISLTGSSLSVLSAGSRWRKTAPERVIAWT